MKTKNLILKLACINLLSFTLFSCAWEPVSDYSKVTDKVTYKKFTTLEDPVVMQLPLDMKFKNENKNIVGTVYQETGSVLVIYDWKNNSVFDYVYAGGRSIPYEILLTQKTADGVTSFYSYDTNDYYIYEMKSNATQLNKIKKTDTKAEYPNNRGGLKNDEVINLVKKGQNDPENCMYEYLNSDDAYHYVCKYLYESGDGSPVEEMSVLVVSKATNETGTIALPNENVRYPLGLNKLNGHVYFFVKSNQWSTLNIYEINPADLCATFVNKKESLGVNEFVIRQNTVIFAGKNETKPTIYSWNAETNEFSENRTFVAEDFLN